MKSVYLCGFMGCGKTHIGKLLAKALGRPFVDLDSYIVQKEKRSIPEIFSEAGEPYFRKKEAECIRELSDGYVVATGGGALINPETAEYANKSGIVVFLDAAFGVCYSRIKNDTNRPLVVSNTKEQLRELYNKRRAVYRRHAEYTVKAHRKAALTVKAILDLISTKDNNNADI